MSELEEALLAQIAEAGLPAPKTEFRFCDRLWRFDLCWDRYKLAVEIEGGTTTRPVKIKGSWWQRVSGHTSMAGYQANCDKYNRAVLEGWRVLRVTKAMIEGEDRAALELIRQGLFPKEASVPQGGPLISPFQVGDAVLAPDYDSGELLPMAVVEIDPLMGVKCRWFDGDTDCWRIYSPSQLQRVSNGRLP